MNGTGTKVVVYDLTSENRPVIKDTVYYGRLKALRMRATQQLYKLGLPCTESVIIVSKHNENKIQYVIEDILSEFDRLLAEIKSTLSVNLPQPVIRVLSVSEDQLEALRELAQMRIIKMLDAHVDRVSTVIEMRKRRDLRKLIRLRREWERIKRVCKDLAIDLDSEILYLLDLIDDAITRSKGDGSWM